VEAIEEAKRRLFYSLIKLRLPLPLGSESAAARIRFPPDPPDRKEIMTGHGASPSRSRRRA
jgi:hypothetical protein